MTVVVTSGMFDLFQDQSEADWGHWSLNNASDISPLLEPDLTSDPAQDSDGPVRLSADQVLPVSLKQTTLG